MAAARAAWPTDAAAGVAGLAPARLVSLDECGVPTGMARLHGRGPRGERARAAVPHGPWTRLSVLGALGHEGVLAAMSVEGRRAARRVGGGPKPRITGEVEAALLCLLEEANHLTLAECRDRLAARTGVRVHPWTVGRALRRCGWT